MIRPKSGIWGAENLKMTSQNLSSTTHSAVEWFQQGGQWLDQGNPEQAIHSFRAALERDPDLVEAHYNLGLAYHGRNQLDLAAASYRAALKIDPDYFSALNNLGQILAQTGNYSEAEVTYHKAMRANPELAEPYFNLGDLAMMRKQLETAVSHYRRAIQIRPEMSEAYNNLGTAFQKLSNFKAAEKCYRKVVGLSPDLAQGHYNLGSILKQLDAAEEAIDHLEKAINLKPKYKEAYNNLALVYKNTGALELAGRYFTEAIAIDPDFAEARWNRSFTYLLNGDFENGWNDFEWRFEQPKWKSLYPFRLKGPRWDGSTRSSLRLLVHDEQGLGDTFQFVRYLPLVKERVGTVIFETRRSLMPLLEGFPGIDEMIERSVDGQPGADFDSFVALMSLPYLFQTGLSTIPNGVPYIHAPHEKVAAWRQHIKGPGLKVGIVWAGRPEHMNDHNRSCRLDQFAALSDVPRTHWFGLQKGPAVSQEASWKSPAPFDNLGDGFEDFTDTAGAIANLDLVITVDTSVAHLAGAMGKPTWVLLPYIPDWRWLMDRPDSPWYPSMKLFRQTGMGDWNSVFGAVKEELCRMTRGNVLTKR